MHRTLAVGLATVISLTMASPAGADDAIKKQLLKLFPQADTDKGGALSDAEETAVRQQILKRFGRADKDGDGVLSDTEMKAVLRQAAKRRNGNKPNSGNSRADKSTKKPDPKALLASLGLKSELNIEYRKNTTQQSSN